jgi:hypothetical protein
MPPVGLGLMMLQARNRLRDLSVRNWSEPSLIASANEGKNELGRLLRHTREDYFVTSVTGTISVTASGNASEITLPNDFAELKDIECMTATFQNIQFSQLDRSDPMFKELIFNQASYPVTDRMMIYHDIIGRITMQFAPGLSTALAYRLWYVQVVPDMVMHTDVPTPIPPEYYDFIVNWVVTDALRSANDPRWAAFQAKIDKQTGLIVNAAQQRRVAADPKFARAFDEGA